jgi:hypothetical protein
VLHFESIQIDEPILDKIESKHRVSFPEPCEACYSDEAHVRRGQEGLYKIFSRTEAGRYLLVVLSDHGDGIWKLVTARDMSQPERRLYQRSMGRG